MSTQRPPKKTTKRWAWIIYQLALAGLNLSDISRSEGVTRGAVYWAARRPYPRMERAIARALGMEPCDIWPERYQDGGDSEAGMSARPGSVCAHNKEKKEAAQ